MGRFVGISKIGDVRRLIQTASPFRDDNSREDTNRYELLVATDPDPAIIKFPGMVELWERFWSEIPNFEFEVM